MSASIGFFSLVPWFLQKANPQTIGIVRAGREREEWYFTSHYIDIQWMFLFLKSCLILSLHCGIPHFRDDTLIHFLQGINLKSPVWGKGMGWRYPNVVFSLTLGSSAPSHSSGFHNVLYICALSFSWVLQSKLSCFSSVPSIRAGGFVLSVWLNEFHTSTHF